MTAFQPSRRQFLGTVAASTLVGTAGCLSALDRSSDDQKRTLRLTLSRVGGSLREVFVADLSETRSDRDDAAFRTVLDGRSYTTQYRKPFASTPETPVYTERGGTYYRLDSVVVDEVETTHPVLRLSEASGETETQSETDADSTVTASELPDVDAKAVRVAQMGARARGNVGGAPWGLLQRGGYVYRDDDQRRASALLGSDAPTHVRYRDRRYRIDVSREQFYEPVYRATVEPVAESPEEMEAILRARFVDARFPRDDLSAAARDVLETARQGEYGESHPYSDAYRDVLRAMHKRAYLDGNISKDAGVDNSGRQILRYDDVYYDYRLRFVDDGA